MHVVSLNKTLYDNLVPQFIMLDGIKQAANSSDENSKSIGLY